MIKSFIESLKNNSADELKEYIKEGSLPTIENFAVDVTIDTVVGSIPMVGNGLLSFKFKKEIENIKELTYRLYEKIDDLEIYIRGYDEIQEQRADMILEYAYEKSKQVEQVEKIKYIANGVTNMLKTENLSFDISKLYLDTLDKLSLLDIAIIERYVYPIYHHGQFQDVSNIIETFDITNEIYLGARDNLKFIGLIETQLDKNLQSNIINIEKNIESLTKTVNVMIDYIVKKQSKIRVKTLKVDKINTKTNYKITKFGKNFYEYIIKLES